MWRDYTTPMQFVLDQLGTPLRITLPEPLSVESFWQVSAENPVIELRSKSDRLRPLQQKMQTWIDNGVQLAWLIDPECKALDVYRPAATHPDILEGVTAVYGEAPVDGFIFELSCIWQ